jgi:hypothetical protein
MRKRIIGRSGIAQQPPSEEKWLDVERIAEVEVTSEDRNFPIESAVVPGREGSGWRAAEQGEQLIRLILNRNFRFDAPIPTRCIDRTASPGKV